MFTQINDIEKLPKVIYSKDGDPYELDMHVTSRNELFIGYLYRALIGDDILCGVISSNIHREIGEYSDRVGHATSFEEAVNMLYKYVTNNLDIKIEE